MGVSNSIYTSNWIKTNGINLHYVSRGKGKLMLMLHGFPEFWYSWRAQIEAFEQDYHVVALDLRGYNQSDKPDGVSAYSLKELIEDIKGVILGLGYEQCILVGHDWGGAIAWYFADAYPEMLEKLIVLNIPHPARFLDGLKTIKQLSKSWYIFFFLLPGLPEWIIRRNNYEFISKVFQGMAVNKNLFTPEDIEAYKQAIAKPGASTAMLNYYRNLFRTSLFNNSKNWSVLEVPTLMIWGENDTALGKELTYSTDKYVKDLTIKYIPNCSHWVQQEKPELVNQYISNFLEGNSHA